MADTGALSQVRQLVTPEGVDLKVRLAPASDRAVALIIDLVIILGIVIVAAIITGATLGYVHMQNEGQVVAIIWLLGFFVLRNFYFTLFECGARAATPGKRIMKIRVAARNGGPLRADAIVARNAMREIELYLPISFLFSGGEDIGAAIVLCGIAWSFIFLFFPLFNKDRLRLGDIIAGTWVLKAPRQVLLPDLTAATTETPGLVFTEQQLDQYGVKELQVLESVLRQADAPTVEAVAERIRAKIGWKAGGADLDFLSAYYAALRRRLEQRLLFGVRKRDKHDVR